MRKSLLLTGTLSLSLWAVDFRTAVYPALEKAGCAGCHHDNGVASATRLRFPEAAPNAEQIEAFGRSLVVLVDRHVPEKSLLLNKPTARMAHAGGRRIQPGSAEEAALRAWIDFLATAPSDLFKAAATQEHAAAGPVLRRLTHSQYNNTIRDLLGDASRLADQFPPEDFVNGFRNQYQAQNTSPLLAESYSVAAEKLAKKAFLGGDTQGILPCKPKSFDDAECRARFVRRFGGKAFRRPLTETEMARYQKLFAAEAAAKKAFVAGAQVVVEIMLQSPNFLMRSENGLDPALRPYETAAKLSYFLWNTMPDDALLKAAAAGELNTPEGVAKQARRMLESPRAPEAVDEFLAEWLRFDRIIGTVRDRRLYPQFTPELTLAMMEETRRLVSDLVWNKGDFMEFFSAAYTFANSDLARLYGLPPPKAEYEKVPLPVTSERAGILGQSSFLTLTSKPAETSPTARGLFVREQLLCQEVPQPPPGVNSNLPPVTREKPMTQRQRLGVHLSSESCAGCHSLIDPIGLAMEKFDAIGGRRETLKLTIFPARFERGDEAKTVEMELDTRGSVAGIANSGFSSPRELGMILAASAQCQRCVVKQLFRWMAGRRETEADRAVLERAFEDFTRSGFQFQELMVALSRWSALPPVEKN
ncbi:MAG: DUF1592 domain-containing protein [Acidobacteria bacterium]|nr:DUF1592 domain-containing protein [Acidobacteriota bacterium]